MAKKSSLSYFERIAFYILLFVLSSPDQEGGTDVLLEAFKFRSEILLSYNIQLDKLISHKNPTICPVKN